MKTSAFSRVAVAVAVTACLFPAEITFAQRSANHAGELSGGIWFKDARSMGYVRLDLRTHQMQTVNGPDTSNVAVSPDGSAVAWIDSHGKFRARRLSAANDFVIDDRQMTCAQSPTFISNSTVAYVRTERSGAQMISFVSVDTGAQRVYMKLPEKYYFTSSDGIAYVPRSGEQNPFFVAGWRKSLLLISARGIGTVTTAEDNIRYPAVSPDGRRVLFVDDSKGLMAANMDGSDVRLIQKSGSWPVWAPDGQHIAYKTTSAVSRGIEQVDASNGRSLGHSAGTFLMGMVIAHPDGSDPIMLIGSDRKPIASSGSGFTWR